MKKTMRYGLIAALISLLLGGITTIGVYLYIEPTLPDIEVLKDVRLQVPLRVYSREGELLAEFGEVKRNPLKYKQVPPQLVHAFLAAEDDRFFEHPGVDYQGLLRAVLNLILTGEKGQGGSTITMQVARNFFLSSEKTYLRKISEIFLSLKIERELSKEDILELYFNKIYLGHRSYGVAAAAQVYYGRGVDELTLSEIAMIAGLPKAPSSYNPVTNPPRAKSRRNYVLGRMHDLGYIDSIEYEAARKAPVTAQLQTTSVALEAPYVAEMVRSEMISRYGAEATYSNGYRVYTTISSELQRAANRAVRTNLLNYDKRHGYRGPEAHLSLPEEPDVERWQELLNPYDVVGGLLPALVITAEGEQAQLYTPDKGLIPMSMKGVEWAQPYIDENNRGPAPEQITDVLHPGDVVRIEPLGEEEWQLSQIPDVSGALVSLHPDDGRLLALVGGFDYFHSKFNRATQAERQPGSNFKPFIYSSALEKGFTAASLINDAPVVFDDPGLESEWRPENYSGRFFGPTRLREALIRSRNLVSIRLLRATGISFAINHIKGFGFDPERLPRDLSLSLGSAVVTPYELVRGYAVIANGGFLVEQNFIEYIEDMDGEELYRNNPAVACDRDCQEEREKERKRLEALLLQPSIDPEHPEVVTTELETAQELIEQPPVIDAPRTVDERNIYIITTIMQDVVRHGTGRRALALGRNDLAGKTGTTNEQRDAWFSGFHPEVVTTAWVGFDTPRPLGNRETGASAALPMWINYMETALAGKPETFLDQPPAMVTYRIDPESGELAGPNTENAIFEVFRVEHAPQPAEETRGNNGDENQNGGDNGSQDITEQLF